MTSPNLSLAWCDLDLWLPDPKVFWPLPCCWPMCSKISSQLF